jgi:hypothetical protein
MSMRDVLGVEVFDNRPHDTRDFGTLPLNISFYQFLSVSERSVFYSDVPPVNLSSLVQSLIRNRLEAK